MKSKALLLCLSASIFLPACGAGSPEAYVEKSAKISCQYLEKCEEAAWTEAGYESISDCKDQFLEQNFDGEGTFRDQFVANCTDFDSGSARKCLSAARKAKNECTPLTQEINEPACEEVCGPPDAMGLALGNPLDSELVARMLEDLEASGELDLEPEGDLAVED